MALFDLSTDDGHYLATGAIGVEIITKTILTTMIDSSDEQIILHKFSNGLRLDTLHVESIDAIDAHVTETLVYDLGVGDADGVVDDVLISAAVVGQDAGEVDDLDPPPTVQRFLDVGGRFLIMDVTTLAATPTEGDLRFAITAARA